ncbi:hypothetical protein LTR37_004021 [Vermiconidia calcicola]|uniref:Uncharacterized protein n=1 Tax=Vermiconidia calcicola TaxID=1690605 RepID=A0ACC3NMP9_9PEZI|nr:hypothetical protein LTR37_004021 [Vermiconidia calcicola]
MAARRPSSSRKSLIGRRRLTTTAKQRLETVAIPAEDDGYMLNNGERRGAQRKEPDSDGPELSLDEDVRHWKLESSVDDFREALLGFEALSKRRDLRLQVLRKLSNPWPDVRKDHYSHNAGHIPRSQLPLELRLPEANAALIPHAAFRAALKQALNDKQIRKILRVQLLRCEWSKEILRIVAVAMQNKLTALSLSILAEPIIRALYRCRKNVSDPDVLRVLNTIIARFSKANLPVNPSLLWLGLRFAARTRSLNCMKRYLQLIREANVGITANVFRSAIAKFSIGHRGLGEIRNGRWRRDQLLQVLKGFDDAKDLPDEKQYHLGSFLERKDWQYLHGWVAVLARCKDSEGVWKEWELWKQSPARVQPKTLKCQATTMTSRKRGDYWFVEQMTMSGDMEKAWKVVKETGLPFSSFKDRIKTRLLDGIEFATVWDDDVRNEMVRKYDQDLRKIERALGVRWSAQASGEDGHGTHELIGDQEEALEGLSADDWKLDPDFGFPYDGDSDVLVPEREERSLHDAEERGLAQQDGDPKA